MEDVMFRRSLLSMIVLLLVIYAVARSTWPVAAVTSVRWVTPGFHDVDNVTATSAASPAKSVTSRLLTASARSAPLSLCL